MGNEDAEWHSAASARRFAGRHGDQQGRWWAVHARIGETTPLRRQAPTRAAADILRHGTMLAVMVPCFVALHDPLVHTAALVVLLALSGWTAVAVRRRQAPERELIDVVAMLGLTLSILLSGHSPGHVLQHGASQAALVAGASLALWGFLRCATVGGFRWRCTTDGALSVLSSLMVLVMAGLALLVA